MTPAERRTGGQAGTAVLMKWSGDDWRLCGRVAANLRGHGHMTSVQKGEGGGWLKSDQRKGRCADLVLTRGGRGLKS